MSPKNKLNKIVSNINALPVFLRSKALSTFFGKMVKFTGTAGTIIEELNENRYRITLALSMLSQAFLLQSLPVAMLLV